MTKLLTTVALLAIVPVLPAAASVVEVTLSGTITWGYDLTDTLGTGSTNLTGQAIEMSFTYDTAVGTRYTTPTLDAVYGGTVYSSQSPTSSYVIIADTTLSLTGDNYGTVQAYDDHVVSGVTYLADETGFNVTSANCQGNTGEVPAMLEESYNIPSQNCTGSGQYFVYDAVQNLFTTLISFSATFDSISFVIDGGDVDPAPVPLPAGAMLLVSGLGAMGVLRRRRHRN